MLSELIVRKRKSDRPGGDCSRFASLVLVTGARNCFAHDVVVDARQPRGREDLTEKGSNRPGGDCSLHNVLAT